MKFSIFQRNRSKTDEELLETFHADQDLEVLGELYNRYLSMVMGLSMKYLKNTTASEDAVMEVFEIIVKRLPNHKVENFKSWLYRVASNHCLDILRKQKRKTEKEIEAHRMYSDAQSRHIGIDWNEELDEKELLLTRMESCIDELVEQQRKCVQLFYIEKKNYEEVSSSLGITWSQTRSFIQNGRRNLKKCMEKKHESAR